MAGIKRKTTDPAQLDVKTKSKKAKVDKPKTKRAADQDAIKPVKSSKKKKAKEESDDEVDSDASQVVFKGRGPVSAEADEISDDGASAFSESEEEEKKPKSKVKADKSSKKESKKEHKDGKKSSKDTTSYDKKATLESLHSASSREAHAKQKALAKERKSAKPNAEEVDRLKHLWEKLRLKSNVTKEERKNLIDQTMEIVTGRIKDFTFKHDSVRIIQSVLKYTTSMEQRKTIARELKGEFKGLAEGKYAKFLVAKLLENGDVEIRSMIIAEFYGNVRRLIGHPEAAWILDDTYRQVASPEQKARLLREWYGPEFSIKGLGEKIPETADLKTILEQFPEKRKPIMDYLEVQINQLIQKKQSGFTILHDAMLQYFLTCKPGTSEANAFLEHLKPDTTLKEGEEADNVDLLKNLAFTKPGSRLVSLAFAYGTAKDRKLLMRPYKDTVEMMAFDVNAHHVLLAALAVTDDTKNSSKFVYGELLPGSENEALPEKVLNIINDVRARSVLLYPFAADSKWLLDDETRERLAEVYAVRSLTSKKEANTRLQEVQKSIEAQLLTAIKDRLGDFVAFSFGLQSLGEILLGAPEVEPEKRKAALSELASKANQLLESGDSTASHGKNLLKSLVQGGKFDFATKCVVPVQPPLGFADMFWDQNRKDLLSWATGQGSWVIVGLVEADGFGRKDEVLSALKKGRKQLEAAAGPVDSGAKAGKKGIKGGDRGNAGARTLLKKL
ncbi:pumilio domain-containing protein [Massarina eburnea CBS 473.64]|uniref:Pumilio domain-containing protein n=1 Tax=Massarina eburnea CBS 473.64 TaxID=1395130 RepID=A0A6A6RXI0_9PLEO|nr:pumilio domain-containing protein [Massarina eburnea CBS 473.64]